MLYLDESRDRLENGAVEKKDVTPLVSVANLSNLLGGHWQYD